MSLDIECVDKSQSDSVLRSDGIYAVYNRMLAAGVLTIWLQSCGGAIDVLNLRRLWVVLTSTSRQHIIPRHTPRRSFASEDEFTA